MIETILIAMARKVIFAGVAFVLFKLADNFYFKAFDTDAELKGSPNAIAILYAGFFIALALV
jgi:hypothetical protein